MKKKFITERKWNQMYDSLRDDLCTRVHEDGSREYTTENFFTWMDRVIDMPEYRIIGVKHQIGCVIDKIKERRRHYTLTHLNMGKLVKNKEDADEPSFHVEGISRDVPWQADRFLAIIIRDYLRFFIKETPAIGNCVVLDNPEGFRYWEAMDALGSDTLARRWEDTVHKVADEFDDLRRLIEKFYDDDAVTDEVIQNATKTAFKDLLYIYPDLNW